jgi:hypothetical protein
MATVIAFKIPQFVTIHFYKKAAILKKATL